ncbi:MAG: tetratricopeptide repeat protein [Deltaproteobacteria bacterium]|nr:tetratricopeptide repeat protein [Deltaproteobacteria bacterium]MCX7953187.1 tetratricopeptide repeat protein [Deltaproteobacteria bacterium]
MAEKCLCEKTPNPEWLYCPFCGRCLKRKFVEFRTAGLTIYLIFCGILVSSVTAGFFLKSAFLGEKPHQPPESEYVKLFDQYLQTADQGILFELVDKLSKKKPADMTNEEKIVLVDSLSILANLYPEDLNIKTNLGLASFLFGAYEKALAIFDKVLEADPSRMDVTGLKIAALIGLRQFEKAEEEIVKAGLSPDQKKFLMDLLQKNKKKTHTNQNSTSSSESAPKSIMSNPATPIVEWMHNHPILGNKLISHSLKEGVLTFDVDSFPYANMPSNILQNFKEKLTALLRQQGLKKIIIQDKTGNVLTIDD